MAILKRLNIHKMQARNEYKKLKRRNIIFKKNGRANKIKKPLNFSA